MLEIQEIDHMWLPTKTSRISIPTQNNHKLQKLRIIMSSQVTANFINKTTLPQIPKSKAYLSMSHTSLSKNLTTWQPKSSELSLRRIAVGIAISSMWLKWSFWIKSGFLTESSKIFLSCTAFWWWCIKVLSCLNVKR